VLFREVDLLILTAVGGARGSGRRAQFEIVYPATGAAEATCRIAPVLLPMQLTLLLSKDKRNYRNNQDLSGDQRGRQDKNLQADGRNAYRN